MFSALFKSAPRANPADFRDKLLAGEALLVDVREAAEWSEGIAESATLLPISELRPPSPAWREFLGRAGQREVLVYCASGMRSSMAARELRKHGVQAFNAGGIRDWVAAGWPIVPPNQSR